MWAVRDAMTDTAVRFGSRDDSPWFLFVYAMQNPLQVSFLPLEHLEPFELPDLDFGASVLGAHFWHRWNFAAFDLVSYKHEYQMMEEDDSDIWVLPGVLQEGNFFVASTTPMPLETFVSNLDSRPVASRGAARGSRDVADVTIQNVHAHPWLQDYWRRKHGDDVSQPHKKRRTLPTEAGQELDDTMLVQVDAELHEMRDEWHRTHGAAEDALEHFKLEHRGGRWTQAHKQVPVDSCRGVSSSAIGARFLTHWSLTRSFLCTFTVYGRGVAELLCHSWCHRMAYFARLWLRAELDDVFEFTEEHVQAYREPATLQAASLEWMPGSPAANRLAVLRQISPQGVGFSVV